jgi:hypothetical protein
MSKPATFSKLMVVGLLGALLLLLVEIRFEHRAALGEDWQSWIPLFYSAAMLVLGAVGLARWDRGGRRMLLVGFAVACVVGLLGLWFHSDGHPLTGVLQVLAAWTLRPGASGGIKAGGPPVLAPLAFMGLGSMGVLACWWRFPAELSLGARGPEARIAVSTADARAQSKTRVPEY